MLNSNGMSPQSTVKSTQNPNSKSIAATSAAISRFNQRLRSSTDPDDKKFRELNQKRIEDFIQKPFIDVDELAKKSPQRRPRHHITGVYDYTENKRISNVILNSNAPEFQSALGPRSRFGDGDGSFWDRWINSEREGVKRVLGHQGLPKHGSTEPTLGFKRFYGENIPDKGKFILKPYSERRQERLQRELLNAQEEINGNSNTTPTLPTLITNLDWEDVAAYRSSLRRNSVQSIASTVETDASSHATSLAPSPIHDSSYFGDQARIAFLEQYKHLTRFRDKMNEEVVLKPPSPRAAARSKHQHTAEMMINRNKSGDIEKSDDWFGDLEEISVRPDSLLDGWFLDYDEDDDGDEEVDDEGVLNEGVDAAQAQLERNEDEVGDINKKMFHSKSQSFLAQPITKRMKKSNWKIKSEVRREEERRRIHKHEVQVAQQHLQLPTVGRTSPKDQPSLDRLSTGVEGSPVKDGQQEEELSPRAKLLRGLVASDMIPKPSLFVRHDVSPTLDLSRQHIGEKFVKLFSDSVTGLPQLINLNISENDLSETSVEIILKSLVKCSEILSLNISRNKLSRSSVQHLANYLRDERCTLTTLICRNNSIDDLGTQLIFSALSENKKNKITHLDLGENAIGMGQSKLAINPNYVSGGQTIANYLGDEGCKLKKLKLDWNHIHGLGAIALMRSLRNNRSIELFDISYNNIHVEGAEMLGYSLTFNKTLRYLYLSQNQISPRACVTLVTGIRSCGSLRQVDLSYNPIGEDGARALAALSTYVGPRVDVIIKECSLKHKDPSVKYPRIREHPEGSYSLHLHHPYERSVFVELIYMLTKRNDLKISPCKYVADPIRDSKNIQEINLVIKTETKPEAVASIELATGIKPRIETIQEIASDINTAKTIFRQFDFDDSGFLDKEELSALLKHLGLVDKENTVGQLLALYDTDGSGVIEEGEFIGFLEEVNKSAHKFQQRTKELRYVAESSQFAPYIPPETGKIEFQISIDDSLGTFLESNLSITNVENLVANAKASNSHTIIDHALTTMRFTAEQALSLFPFMLKEYGDRVRVLTKLVPRMISSLEVRLLISSTISSVQEKLLLRQALEPLYRPLFGLVNGFYFLDLSEEIDARCLQCLIEINNSSIADRKKNLGDTSQLGDWTCFRNLVINNRVVHKSQEVFDVKPPCKLHFDFVTMHTPGITTTPISDVRFVNIMIGLGLIDEEEKSNMFIKISKYDTEAKDTAHGIGLREFCLSLKSSEYAARHRQLFYHSLTHRSLVDTFEAYLLDNMTSSELNEYNRSQANSRRSSLQQLDRRASFGFRQITALEKRQSMALRRQSSNNTRGFMPKSPEDFKIPDKPLDLNEDNEVFTALPPNLSRKESKDSIYKNAKPVKRSRSQETFEILEAQYTFDNFHTFMKANTNYVSIVDHNRWKRSLEAIQDTLGGRYITCAQLAVLTEKFSGGTTPNSMFNTFRVDMIVSFFSNLVDPINFEVIVKSITPMEIGMLQCRLGFLNLWNPLKPEGYVFLDLSRREERQLFRILLLLSVIEPGQNWLDSGYWHSIDIVTLISTWTLPASWMSENSLPERGVVRLRYYSGEGVKFGECSPDLTSRLALMALVYSQPYVHDTRFTHKPTLDRAEKLMQDAGLTLSFLAENQKILHHHHHSQSSKTQVSKESK